MKALVGDGGADAPRLWVVTRGAQSVGEEGVLGRRLRRIGTLGLGRSLALAVPDRWGGLIDLDPGRPAVELTRLADLLMAGGA